jgi:hypothetical protein
VASRTVDDLLVLLAVDCDLLHTGLTQTPWAQGAVTAS